MDATQHTFPISSIWGIADDAFRDLPGAVRPILDGDVLGTWSNTRTVVGDAALVSFTRSRTVLPGLMHQSAAQDSLLPRYFVQLLISPECRLPMEREGAPTRFNQREACQR